MTDWTEDLLDSTGPSTGESEIDQTQPDQEANHVTVQETTEELETHAGALRVVTSEPPAQDAAEDEDENIQPVSAFSFSSSDEDAEADDEGAEEIEEDEDDDEDGESSASSNTEFIGTDNRPDEDEQVSESDNARFVGTDEHTEGDVSPLEEPSSFAGTDELSEGDVSPLEQPPSPLTKPVYAVPAVWGVPHKDDSDYTLLRSIGFTDWTHYHDQSSSSSEERKKKRRKRQEALPDSIPTEPSPLRTTSSPDSPVSPKNKKLLNEFDPLLTSLATRNIGVLPQPSPILDAEPSSEPFSDRDSTPRPDSRQPRRTSAVSFDWSEEEEDDGSWVNDAVERLRGSRPASEVKTADKVSITESQIEEDDTDDADNNESNLSTVDEVLIAEDQKRQQEDTDNVDNNESNADDSNAATPKFESSSLPNHAVHSQKRSFGFHLTTECENSDSSNRPTDTQDALPEDAQVAAEDDKAPENIAPVFDAVDEKGPVDVTSPTPDGPEPLTGLTPEQGLAAWMEWVSRTKRERFITNRHSDDVGSSGDFRKTVRSKDKSNAAAYLRKQRVALKSDDPDGVDVQLKLDELLEHMKLQMLRYRAQRNQHYYEARDNQDRVGRRNRTIFELEQRLEEYKFACNDANTQLKGLEPLVDRCEMAEQGYDKEYMRRKQLQGELHKLSAELKRTQMFSEQYRKSAEANADIARLQRVRQNDEELNMSSSTTKFSQNLNGNSSETATGPWISTMGPDHPRQRRPTPAPEQFVYWFRLDRRRLAVYMAEWINGHREQQSSAEPISETALELMLAVEPMTWNQFIQQLQDAGYIIRPDRFAEALTNSEAIQAGDSPRPGPAVMYAARRLTDRSAVRDLLQEVAVMEKGLEDAQSQGSLLQVLELENELQMLRDALPEDLVSEIQELKEQIIDRNEKTIELHQGLEAAEIAAGSKEVPGKNMGQLQRILSGFVKSTRLETDTQDPTLTLEAELAACNMHGKQLQIRVDTLLQKLSTMKEEHQRLKEDYQNVGEDCKSWEERCARVEAGNYELEKEKLRFHFRKDAADSDRAKLESEIDSLKSQLEQTKSSKDNKYSTCKQHSANLQSRIDELEVELETLQLTGQANSTLPLDLTSQLQASKQDVADLQAAVDGQQQVLDEANKSTAAAESALAASTAANVELSTEIAKLRRELAAARELPQATPQHDTEADVEEKVPHETEDSPQASRRSYEFPWPKPIRIRPVWQERETKIRVAQGFVKDQDKRKSAREQRQREELQRLDWIQRTVGKRCGMREVLYVPLEKRFVVAAH